MTDLNRLSSTQSNLPILKVCNRYIISIVGISNKTNQYLNNVNIDKLRHNNYITTITYNNWAIL